MKDEAQIAEIVHSAAIQELKTAMEPYIERGLSSDNITAYHEFHNGLRAFTEKAQPIEVVEKALVIHTPTLPMGTSNRTVIETSEQYRELVEDSFGFREKTWAIYDCPSLSLLDVEARGRDTSNGLVDHLTKQKGLLSLDDIAEEIYGSEAPHFGNIVREPTPNGKWLKLEFKTPYTEK